MKHFSSSFTMWLASSRRSVSQGTVQKTARQKIKKKCGERKWKRSLASSCCAFFIFLPAVFCAAPWLTECLEEAIMWFSLLFVRVCQPRHVNICSVDKWAVFKTILPSPPNVISIPAMLWWHSLCYKPKTINSVFSKFMGSLSKDYIIIPIPGQKIMSKYRFQSA